MSWENRLLARGGEPLVDPAILRNSQLRAGLTSFFSQYFVQGGLFFAVPLFLSVALGLSAIETGRAAAAALGRRCCSRRPASRSYFPDASPRRVCELGFLTLFAGLVVLIAALDAGRGRGDHDLADAAGGARRRRARLAARQRDRLVGARRAAAGRWAGLQNTLTNLGISISTALTGAILIAALSSSFLTGVQAEPSGARAGQVAGQHQARGRRPVRLRRRTRRRRSRRANVPTATADAIVEENETPRLYGLRRRSRCWRSSPCWRCSSAAACRMSSPPRRIERTTPPHSQTLPRRSPEPARQPGGSRALASP